MMRTRVRWLAILALLVWLIPGGAARADSVEAEPIDLEKLQKLRTAQQRKHAVASRVSRYLAAAAEASDEGSPAEGQALLDKLNPRRLNPYERALLYRLKAYLSYASAEYEAAIENFEKVLAEEVLSLNAENKIRFNIAQLYASLQKWPEVIASIERWLRYVQQPADPLGYYLMAIAYFQMDDLASALTQVETAVDLSPEPPEGWLQLLTALYVQKEDYQNVAPVLEELVMRFPKKAYWVQLSLIYGARDNYSHSLAVQQVAYLQGFLTEDKEVRRLARSYLYNDLPHPAATVLEKGLADGVVEPEPEAFELLANSWIAAREYDRSLAPLQRAAELSDEGNLYVRLGQVHLQREEWSEAANYLRDALDKGGLKDAGNAQLLLGIAYYNDQRVERARSSFERARRHESTRGKAESWISHLDTEARTG